MVATVGPRGNPGNPPITAGLELYVDPDKDVYSDDIGTLATDTDNIRRVLDRSDNGFVLDQTTGVNQFTYAVDALGAGNNALYKFTQTQWLDLDSTLSITATGQSITFYTVYEKTGIGNYTNYIGNKTNGTDKPNSNFNRILEYQGNRIYFQDETGVTHFASITNSPDLAIRAFVLDTVTDNIKTYFNGTLIGNSTLAKTWGTFNFSRFWSQGGDVDSFFGYIGRTLLYSVAHDSTQVAEMTDWLNDKYSVY